MSICGIDTNNIVSALNLQAPKPEAAKIDGLSEIFDTFSESEEASKFKEIVNKYDITNISRNELNQMYKELHDNGLISLKDMLVTFDPTRIPGWQDGVSSISGWKVSSNPDQKMNVLEGLKTQAEWYKKFGDPQFQNRYDENLELARKIHYFQT